MLNALKIASSRWGVAMGIFIIGFISYGLTLAFYAAIFPRLVRDTRCICELREGYKQGEITADEYEQAEALEKSKISSLSIVGALFSSSRPPPVMTCRSSFWRCRLHRNIVARPGSRYSPPSQHQSRRLCPFEVLMSVFMTLHNILNVRPSIVFEGRPRMGF